MDVSHSVLNKLIAMDTSKDTILKNARDIKDDDIGKLYLRWLAFQYERARLDSDILKEYMIQIQKQRNAYLGLAPDTKLLSNKKLLAEEVDVIPEEKLDAKKSE